MKFAVLCISLLFSSLAFGQGSERGGHDGGGGQGVVCYNPQNEIESVELLDLYEGRNLENLIYQEMPGTYKEIFETVAQASDSRVQKILDIGQKIIPVLRFMAKGIRLKPIGDSNTIFIPSNCKVEQLVNFQGLSRIFVVTDFWEKLSETNKAALIAHEILWANERFGGVLYSSRARRAVARLFASNYSIKPSEFNPERGDIECWAQNEEKVITAEFYIPKNTCKVHFKEINSGDIYGIHEANLYEENCADWKNYFLNIPTTGDIVVTEDNLVFNVQDVGENISSHEINIDMKRNQNEISLSLSTKNWEFSGFNTKNHQLNCFTVNR